VAEVYHLLAQPVNKTVMFGMVIGTLIGMALDELLRWIFQ
jgi:hypothetical protein